ncbi:hypothetical protein Taro_037595 [Colocasia esculenta]|uniref:Uncharacterized protein n=1 Tax=Colocasia esculenta TaxID=4460 RepID=A0A843WDA0_COLES|nr:hypothetical protein [Colocasia esculenta]
MGEGVSPSAEALHRSRKVGWAQGGGEGFTSFTGDPPFSEASLPAITSPCRWRQQEEQPRAEQGRRPSAQEESLARGSPPPPRSLRFRSGGPRGRAFRDASGASPPGSMGVKARRCGLQDLRRCNPLDLVFLGSTRHLPQGWRPQRKVISPLFLFGSTLFVLGLVSLLTGHIVSHLEWYSQLRRPWGSKQVSTVRWTYRKCQMEEAEDLLCGKQNDKDLSTLQEGLKT